ncbi:MAG TPA: hypothetical protein VFF75_04395 [Methylophilaceae bacterium]|nr:hypothetical protein [Methylophilaceae bacterium]
MALKHAKTSAAGPSSDPAKVGGDDWNADHVVDQNGFDMAAGPSTPAAPSAGHVRMFGRSLAGGALPAYVGPSGLASVLQPLIGRNKVGMWSPSGNANTSTGIYFGMLAPSFSGTPQTRNVSTDNMFQSLRRIGCQSNSAAGSRALIYSTGLQYWRGNAANCGGFRAIFRWGCADAAPVAGAKTFVGFSASSGIATTTGLEVSAALNLVGIGTDSTDNNLCVIHNDGAGLANKINLGDDFPANTLSADAYELALFCPPNSDSISYEVTRLNRPDISPATGIITSDLPANSQLLLPIFLRSNGNTALAVAIDMISLYIETDY